MIELILQDQCTGCGDCVVACPDHVLDVGAEGQPPVIARIDQCQTCFMCELYCAQDAIYVAVEGSGVGSTLHYPKVPVGRLRHDYGWDGKTKNPLGEFSKLGRLLREGLNISTARHERRRGALSHGLSDASGDSASIDVKAPGCSA